MYDIRSRRPQGLRNEGNAGQVLAEKGTDARSPVWRSWRTLPLLLVPILLARIDLSPSKSVAPADDIG